MLRDLVSELGPDGRLLSDLWYDAPTARDHLARLRAGGQVAPEEASRLERFVEHGYLTLHIEGIDALAEAFEREIAQLWIRKPADLLVTAKGSTERLRLCDCPDSWQRSGYRLADLHSHVEAARRLYLAPEIFRFVELLFGSPALAFQSLYFHDGSEQALHRDPMFVPAYPPSHLLAAWIALEDVDADAGPLILVPGSHRLPYFEFESGHVRVSEDAASHDGYDRYTEFTSRQMAERGLEVRRFACKRGDVLLWHGSLLHGGDDIERDDATRKSFVVHYTTRDHYRERVESYQAPEAGARFGAWRPVVVRTDRILEQDGCRGLANPAAPGAGPWGDVRAPGAGGWRARLAALRQRLAPRRSRST